MGARAGESEGEDGELQIGGFEEWGGQGLEGHGSGVGGVGGPELRGLLCMWACVRLSEPALTQLSAWLWDCSARLQTVIERPLRTQYRLFGYGEFFDSHLSVDL